MFIPKFKTWHQNIETATSTSVHTEAGSKKVMCKDKKEATFVWDFSGCTALQIHSDCYFPLPLCTVQ